jgi:hypothetical protein
VPRTIIVGDVHGCSAELQELLDRVALGASDRLVFVGDLVVRGPDPRSVLAIARRAGARVARGNHENKLLGWRTSGGPLGPDHARVAEALSEEDWAQLAAMPLWLDLPEHGVRVVHAGVLPGVAIADVPGKALLKMRTIDRRGRWSDEPDAGELWGNRYEGPPHVVFGHNARSEPQLHPWATGIDTGCVYGKRLTAIVLPANAPMPRGEDVRPLLHSVPARRRYYGDGNGPMG